ncbi:MAG: hypothetical protein A2498_15845 [Lentisphaerae bacterium RIFOXYC12_FULL_60_16]|nr:MAG: hypothetical protein A2498_15845 [Lentisphaerae bacterium RIFOXYC12_FULL_60_16]OGV69400.1 MAG: hypothetical protein A2269_01645 [Lentisphaerae bacterium RIFOXYA12_FULL_60_10]OGV79161.1 MAG: hypothetical protein A2340_03445 [Lentisphaerae bacterium RIFOXYB12_FULL_60_10]
MPIYEYYCPDCHMVFNFFSKRINPSARPACPKCARAELERQVSAFALGGKRGDSESSGMPDDFPVDERKMERAITELASQAESIKEDDPRQAANLMRKFSKMTGMEFGKGMDEAIGRLEAGDDPEQIEKEMGDLMEKEEPFVMAGGSGKKGARSAPPVVDRTLYDL